jgi:hypothetical protein
MSTRTQVSHNGCFVKDPDKERSRQRIRDCMMYNDWELHSFVQMLEYKCLWHGKEQLKV